MGLCRTRGDDLWQLKSRIKDLAPANPRAIGARPPPENHSDTNQVAQKNMLITLNNMNNSVVQRPRAHPVFGPFDRGNLASAQPWVHNADRPLSDAAAAGVKIEIWP